MSKIAKLDIEEKFKRDISKEVANLKEFLISQGKEIVKLKQENKALRESSSSRSENGSVPPDLHAVLEKHTKELAKQKENTTKLSKLCLGTLNELEKFEKKQERESSVQPKNDDKIKRLGDENKKLIHLVTALDQQVTVLEAKLNKSLADGERSRHNSGKPGAGDLTREEVLKIVRDSLPNDNQERDAQVQSVVEEVQNIIGQVRDLGAQTRDVGDKVRLLERNDTNDKFGVELAETISRVEAIERQGLYAQSNKKTSQQNGPLPDAVSKRLDKLEISVGAVERLDIELRHMKTSVVEQKTHFEDYLKQSEEKMSRDLKSSEEKMSKDVRHKLTVIEGELNKTSTAANNSKLSVEDLARKVDRLQKEEEAARAVRKDQNLLSVEDIKKDFVKVQEQANYLEEKIVDIRKTADSNGIESRNKCNKLSNDLELLTEKVKNMSLTLRDDKFKQDEKISKLGSHGDLITQLKDDMDKMLKNTATSQNRLEKTIGAAEELAKVCSRDLQSMKSDVANIKTGVEKCVKNVDDNGAKIFGCVQDCDMLKDNLDKLKKAVDRRPAAEDLDKKSELTNKLYNDLSAKIDDVDVSLQKETKKTRSDIEKACKDIKTLQSKCDDSEVNRTKDLKVIKDDVVALKTSSGELKTISKDISTLKTDCDRLSKDFKVLSSKVDEVKKDVAPLKSDTATLQTKLEKVQLMEKEIEQLKKEKSVDKLTSIEKDISSLRADHEKLNKDVKSVSTEVKFVDSTVKKDAASNKTELSSFSKSIKDFEKDLNTIHNMIDVLNADKTGKVTSDDLTKLKNEITKSSKSCEETISKRIDKDIKDIDGKIQKLKDDLTSKVSGVEKKTDGTVKGMSEVEVNRLIKASKDDINTSVDTKVKKSKDEVQISIDKLKDDIKKVNDLNTKISKHEDSLSKFQKSLDSLESSSKTNKSGDEWKREIDKVNQTLKDNMKTLETKLTNQEKSLDSKIIKNDNQVTEIKTSLKDLSSKTSSKPDDGLKKEVDKISTQMGTQEKSLTKQISDCQKTFQDKLTAHEKSVHDQLAKIEKEGSSAAASKGGETAKLATLTKAIDSIQENSKSLETMVKKMKTEFATPKDLEKLRVELGNKAGPGKLDPTHPDMGPIMDSLIMTNDRPYIDCGTTTPMTGNGLVKFERFNAINKLPWDDVNDQFIIQEPGVYAVFVTALLQDATLSVKIASNMLEREIFNIGSREGLVGCSAPCYVSRGGLLQIDDDENVADTVIVEIHADNEESFVDKNITFTMYKIGESPGGE